MTWSMLLPCQGDLRDGGVVEALGDTVPGDYVTDTTEFRHNDKDEAERHDVEASAVAAKCHAKCQDDVLLFSDTVKTQVRSKLKSSLKACAQHIEVWAIPPHCAYLGACIRGERA